MGNLILTAPAKINLSLNVLPQRGKNGYFEVRFINSQAALSDRLIVRHSKTPGICLKGSVAPPERDLALRAARILMERYGLKGGMSLRIEKHIPLKAGLGGGSADAASVINGLAAHAGLELSPEEKNGIAQELGMDVCYCVVGGLCTVSGTGEIVRRLPFSLPQLDLLIATPHETKPSTAWAYSILSKDEMGRSVQRYEVLLQCIEQGDIQGMAENMHNDFELPMERHFPVIVSMRETMTREGALRALLAGSGLSVFGIFTDAQLLKRAKRKLEQRGVRCFATRTIV
jgi:4-diphosphocytidyl-2-C-methyl-D-erythritol kinase